MNAARIRINTPSLSPSLPPSIYSFYTTNSLTNPISTISSVSQGKCSENVRIHRMNRYIRLMAAKKKERKTTSKNTRWKRRRRRRRRRNRRKRKKKEKKTHPHAPSPALAHCHAAGNLGTENPSLIELPTKNPLIKNSLQLRKERPIEGRDSL